ncbi:MAG: ABC transporter permease [Egibacteraceae bacterium]
MSGPQIVWLIIRREATDRLRSKVYVYGTLAVTVAMAGLVLYAGLSADEPARYEVGVVGAVPTGFDEVLAAGAAGQDVEVELAELADREAAAAAITAGEVDAVLLDATELMADGFPDAQLATLVETALHQAATAADLEAAGLSDEQLAVAMTPPPPLDVVDPDGTQDEDGAFGAGMVGFASTLLLFLALSVNAGSLLTGAVEEKSSRVIEVLLGSVRPWQLLTAKITAMTALALGQIAVLVGAVLAANAVADTVELPPATAATVVVALVMLVLGFVFFAALYTVAGSLAANAEDAQGSAGPLNFILIGTYFAVVFAVLPDPGGVGAQVLTYLPPTAPFTVPARVAFDVIPLWQVVASCTVTLAGTVATVALAGRLYSASLLAGGKLTWREAWQGEPVG